MTDVSTVVSTVETDAKAALASLESRVSNLEQTVVTKAKGLWANVVSWVKTHWVALGAVAATPVGSAVVSLVKHLF